MVAEGVFTVLTVNILNVAFDLALTSAPLPSLIFFRGTVSDTFLQQDGGRGLSCGGGGPVTLPEC